MSAPHHSGDTSSAFGLRRLIWAGAGALALLFTFLAFTQAPRADATRHMLGPIDWLLHPVNRNSFAHRPTVTQNMRAVAALDGTPLVWVVGDGNLIIRSTDGGRSWQQATIDTARAPVAPDPSASAALAAERERRQTQVNAVEDSVVSLRAALVAVDSLRNEALVRAKAAQSDPRQQTQSIQPQSVYGIDSLLIEYARQRDVITRDLRRRQNRLKALLEQPATSEQLLLAPSVVNLHDVHFASPSQGWAVGDYGIVLATADSGRTWRRTVQLPAVRLDFVHFTDARTGTIVAPDNRATFVTRDGGDNWTRHDFDRTATLRAAGAWGDSLQWVELDSARAFVSRDDGRNWAAEKVPLSFVADDGRIALSSPGLRWLGFSEAAGGVESLPADLEQRLDAFDDSGADELLPDSVAAVHIGPDKEAWVLSTALYHTTDGGRSWPHVVARHKMTSIHFFDVRRGVATSDAGVILRTRDGGRTWKELQTDTREDLTHVSFFDARLGYALTRDGDLLTTTNGNTWQEATDIPRDDRNILPNRGIRFFSDSAGIVLLTDGTLHGIRRIAGNWEVLDADTTQRFLSASFLNAKDGMAVGVDGSLRVTSDSARTWQYHYGFSNTPASVSMIGPDSVFVLDADGTLRFFTGGDPVGAIIVAATTASRVSVAPWYYIAMLVLLILALLLSRVGGDIRSAIEGTFASDRPLEPEDFDSLGVKPIARAVSRFLRNSRTRAPLTLAITGKWGSGKSSLLNLIQADLRTYGLRPVWFNAWHHQKEDSLLAALLDTIRKDAVPPFYTPSGIFFRVRLTAIRARRRWFASAMMIVAGYILLPLIYSVFAGGLGGILEMLASFQLDLTNIGKSWGEGSFPVDPLGLGKIVAVLIGIGTGYTKILRAFGMNPAALLSTRAGTGTVRDLAAQTGFRHEFAQEFRDVTRALGVYRLVIIVDDLDRCRPANVLDVLEAINFLVSSGDCFILLGIDREQVVSYVGMAFKDAAEELAAQNGGHADSRFANMDPPAVRAWYAQEYLEKLINLDIAVPAATAAGVKDVLAPAPKKSVVPSTPTDWRARLTPIRVRIAVAASILLLLGATAFATVRWGGDPVVEEPPVVAESTPAPAPVTPNDSAGGDTGIGTPAPGPIGVASSVAAARVVPPVIDDRRFSVVSLAFALFALVLVWRFLRQPDPVVRDSEDFVFGIRACGPLVFGKRDTPRAAKKFLNRVRYYAMRQRPEEVDVRLIDSIADWINTGVARIRRRPVKSIGLASRRTIPSEREGYDVIPEKLLVALTAVHYHDAAWTGNTKFWEDPTKFLSAQGLRDDVIGELQVAIGQFGDIMKYRDDFDDLVKDTR